MPDMPPDPSQWIFGETPNTIILFDFHYHGLLVVVTPDGEVRINWKNVEATVVDPKAEPTCLAYARMLLAARDGTAKPLDDKDQ